MIITRSPLRVSLGGGGTDLPSYYREHGGFVLSAAIDRHVYITLHETFQREYLIKYSATEVVQTIDEIKHPIIREALRLVPRQVLAEQASHIEIDLLKEPVGKQDQYIASFGGITGFEFRQDGAVDVT